MFSISETTSSTMTPDPDTIAGGYTRIATGYYHPSAARNTLGLVGGNEVSLAAGNLVDVESDLRGVTRTLSKDPSRQWQGTSTIAQAPISGSTNNGLATFTNSVPTQKTIAFTERATGRGVTVDIRPQHLPTIQMMSYPGVPNPEPFVQEVYGASWRF